jgi:hypothetical protein
MARQRRARSSRAGARTHVGRWRGNGGERRSAAPAFSGTSRVRE